MIYKTILFDQDAGVATITFNRPDKLNALNHDMLSEFKHILDQVSLPWRPGSSRLPPTKPGLPWRPWKSR